jgi:hypothetical protein
MVCLKIIYRGLVILGMTVILTSALVACGGPETTKYTEDQVIAIIKSYAPTCAQTNQDAVYTATYQSGGKWKVIKECVEEENVVSSETWYFDENLGKAQRGF